MEPDSTTRSFLDQSAKAAKTLLKTRAEIQEWAESCGGAVEEIDDEIVVYIPMDYEPYTRDD